MSNSESIPLTKEGYESIKIELDRLKREDRPTIIKEIEVARSHGDLRENAEYHAAKEKQGFIEARIADLDDKLSRVKIIENIAGGEDRVRFGAYVTVNDEESGESKTYRLVGELEANIAVNKISITSPLGKALLGKFIDETFQVKAPKGTKEYTIVEIRY